MLTARRILFLTLSSGVLFLLGCSSATPGGSRLYDTDVEPPRLLDSTVRIKTYRNPKARVHAEERLVVCSNEKIKANVVKPNLAGDAELSVYQYSEIWNALLSAEAFKMTLDGMNPEGGPYHVVYLSLGKETHEFSIQHQVSFLGTQSRDTTDRLDILRKIAQVLDDAVPLKDVPPQEERDPKTPNFPTSQPTSMAAPERANRPFHRVDEKLFASK